MQNSTTKHVVAISGGKDSVALALRLKEVEPRDYVYLITRKADRISDLMREVEQLRESKSHSRAAEDAIEASSAWMPLGLMNNDPAFLMAIRKAYKDGFIAGRVSA